MSAGLDPEIVVVAVEVVEAEAEAVEVAVEAEAESVIEDGLEIVKDLDDSEPCHFYLILESVVVD